MVDDTGRRSDTARSTDAAEQIPRVQYPVRIIFSDAVRADRRVCGTRGVNETLVLFACGAQVMYFRLSNTDTNPLESRL